MHMGLHFLSVKLYISQLYFNNSSMFVIFSQIYVLKFIKKENDRSDVTFQLGYIPFFCQNCNHCA